MTDEQNQNAPGASRLSGGLCVTDYREETKMNRTEMNRTESAAMKALAAGGYLSVFGNGAMYHAESPDTSRLGSGGKQIALKRAQAMAEQLEHFADGCKWPYPSLYRVTHNAKLTSGALTAPETE